MRHHTRPTVSLAAAAFLIAACASAAPSTQPTTTPVASAVQPSPVATSEAQESTVPAAPVIVLGMGDQNTAPFELMDGSYKITLTGDSTRDIGSITFKMYPVTPDPSNARDVLGWLLFNERATAVGAYSFETNEYNLTGRSYYVDGNVPGGPWSVTFEPHP